MSDNAHPFTKLRRTIRQSGRQYRQCGDTSKSVFFPDGGFVYGYDMGEVERALDAYEATLPSEYHEEQSNLTIEARLIREANSLSAAHPDMKIRDFARCVAAYMAMNEDPSRRHNPLRLLKTDFLNTVDEDTL